MKRTSLFLAILLLISTQSYADHGGDKVMLEAEQVKIQVKGVVCSFCAYGAQKSLSKLKFLNRSIFTKGVHVDIKNQQITLALEKEKYLDLKKLYKSIKKGGYDPQIVFLRVKGNIVHKNQMLTITDQRSGLTFAFPNKGDVSGDVEVDLHFDAKLIPKISPDQVIKASFDGVVSIEGAKE